MPGKIKVKVLAGRNLPVMDRASDTTDAFVEIKFGNVTHKTDVCRKTLNPHWSSTEWYRFEVDESELQDEPLQLRLMDHDTYSANDAIGKVVISLAPLLARETHIQKGVATPPTGAVMSGWIPVFDTMHGIRGELNVIVKVELFTDFNKYKTSSCGVQFFHCPTIPPGYKVSAIHGFVEELVVNDDPEYQWIDKIRTPRASNEARQVAFIKLSNQVQRLVGVKAAELGANAVVGYQQDFDLEGEAGVVARAIGTAVSITALPSPCQPLNLPLCTQQQLKKYLDILATDSESIPDLNIYFKNHQDQLQKLLTILNPKTPALLDENENPDEDEKSEFSRQASLKTYTGNLSIYQDDCAYASQKSLKHISEDQTDLNKLLKRTDDSDSDSNGPLQRIKSIKTNFFTKRFGSVRRKSEKQDDQISIKSNSSDTSRISLHDIKKEFKKLKRLKKPKFHKTFVNKEDEGVGMASILARSVIHAHTSLACIAETQDSEPSPNSTTRRTSESEPTINLSDEDKETSKIMEANLDKYNLVQPKRKMSDIHSSLKEISIHVEDISMPPRKLSESCPATPMVTRSENLLKLPGELGYYGSLSLSGDSSEMFTSSEEDDESSDQKTDTEKSLETTSSVVQSVLNKNNNTSPVEITKNFVNTEHFSSESEYSKSDSEYSLKQQRHNDENKQTKLSDSSSTVASTVKHIDIEHTKKDTHHGFKFHMPFTHKKVSKSVSAPSSPIEKTGFMYRSSKRIKNQFAKISKSNMIKSISHISLIHRKKKPIERHVGLSQRGSSSDIPSKAPSHETVLGSPFLSYADLLSLDKEPEDKFPNFDDVDHSKVTMYIGSEPVSRASISGPSSIYHGEHEHKHDKKEKCELKPTGLVHTAMETILMEKVQSLLVPATPEPLQSKEQIFFDDINEKLGKVEEARNRLDNTRNLSITTNESVTTNASKASSKNKFKKDSLIHTAMETILIDKFQSLLTPTTPDATVDKELLFSNKYNDHDKIEIEHVGGQNNKPESLIQTAMKTMLIDKAQSLLPPNAEANQLEEKKADNKIQIKKTGVTKNASHNSLFHTAMETMLIDKVQSVLPPIGLEAVCNENIIEEDRPNEKDIVDKKNKDDANELDEKTVDTYIPCEKTRMTKNASHNNLFHTAMETMLIDKVQSVLPPIGLEAVCNENIVEEDKPNKKDVVVVEKNKGDATKSSFLYDALQTISLDKVQSIVATILPDLEISRREKEVFADVTNIHDEKFNTQNSIQSIHDTDDGMSKMSKEIDSNIVIPCKITQNKAVLQHFHPILSGAPLETIPSLPECSFDQTQSLDIEGVEATCECQTECYSETNSASVCDNSHAACGIDRSEGDHEKSEKERDRESPRHIRHESYGSRDGGGSAQQLQHPSAMLTASTPMGIHRRSSDSDLSVTPKGGSFNTSGNAGSGGGAILRPSMNSNNLDMLEYPFLTMSEYPPGFIVNLGGTVCARSVKLVDAGGESAARAAWWAELRTELRAHARALRCNAVLAYSESAAICEDVCVLSASGTAAVINLDCDFTGENDTSLSGNEGNDSNETTDSESDICTMAHVPYSPGAGPYRAELSTCGGCRKARVPAVLLATCAKPSKLPAYSKAISLSAVAARVRRAPPASEPAARDISDQLPFLEYELHKLLLAKLRMQGANALFSLNTQIAIGERCVIALATGIAVRLIVLPPPTPPRIKAIENDKEAVEIQKALWESFMTNKTVNGWVDNGMTQLEMPTNGNSLPEIEGEEPPALDLCVDKDACVLELDEAEDVETARALAIRRPHAQVFTPGLKASKALPPYAYAQVFRGRFVLSGPSSGVTATAEKHFNRALDGVAYKLRRLQPYALVTPRFQLELPEDEIQLVLSGTAIQLADNSETESGDTSLSHSNADSNETNSQSSNTIDHGNGTGDDDDIFVLDEDQLVKSTHSDVMEDRNIVVNGQIPTTVTLTSLSHVSGAKAAKRICALRLLFVRETTAVRELGGLSGFLHTFTCEVLAIVRAYTAALGGNALTSYYITQLMLQDNAHKNQGQCLLSVGGDVVQIMY